MKIIDNSLDSKLDWKSRFFFARLSSERDSWCIPDRWDETLPKPVSTPTVGLAASQQLALMYLRRTVLRWFPSKEFFCWCGASTHLITTVLVPSLLEAKRKYGKKEHLHKRVCSSTEGESVRERGTNLQVTMAPRVASATTYEASVELAQEGMVNPTSASPLEGFFVVIKGDSLMESDSSSEGFSMLPPLKGTLKCLTLRKKRDVSLLREQIALLRSREAKLIS
ncbi:hypothetical protein ACLOJK_023161 [Asimina triloba]